MYSVDPWNLTKKASVKRQSSEAYGGYSSVYRGTMRVGWSRRVKVAIKVLRPRGCETDDERFRKRLYREVRIWSQMNHQNVIQLYGFILSTGTNGRPAIISPWCQSGNVFRYLKRNITADRLPILRGVVSGLEYIHSQSVVHADIKGENVLIDDYGNALLCDFGLSNNPLDNITESLLTSSMRLAVTLRYSSPELLADESKSQMSDMWAFGCLVVQIWTDLFPYPYIQHDQAVLRAIGGKSPFEASEFELLDPPKSDLFQYASICWNIEPDIRPTAVQFRSKIDELIDRGLELRSPLRTS